MPSYKQDILNEVTGRFMPTEQTAIITMPENDSFYCVLLRFNLYDQGPLDIIVLQVTLPPTTALLEIIWLSQSTNLNYLVYACRTKCEGNVMHLTSNIMIGGYFSYSKEQMSTGAQMLPVQRRSGDEFRELSKFAEAFGNHQLFVE